MKRNEMKGSEMNNNNNSNFVMFGNYREYFELLNAEQSHKLILMLFDFARTQEIVHSDDLNINLVYKAITDNMNIGKKRRIASVENGKKGGRPRKNEPTQKQIDIAKKNNIDITGKSRTELGDDIEKNLKEKKQLGNYVEPTFETPNIGEDIAVEELEELLKIGE